MCEQDQATIPVREAVGLILGHDITEIDPRTGFKGCRFRRGHVITENDIPKLLDLGKENIYALDIGPGQLHEDDAVRRLASALAGKNTHFVPEPREGKLSIIASIPGILKVDVAALERFNSGGEVMCATRHTNTMVAAGDVVAGTRAIPLIADAGLVEDAAGIARRAGGIIEVKPLAETSVALVITGNEVYSGRIKDAFEPVIREKVAALGSSVDQAVRCPDDITVISDTIERLHREGAGLIILTGGMSVDPDDVTLAAARAAGVEIKFYGSPVLPGAMFMSGCFADGTPVLGVPACGIHHPRTVLDLVLPRALAGEIVEGKEMARLGHGGLCLDCPDCRFPVCPFGKGQ